MAVHKYQGTNKGFFSANIAGLLLLVLVLVLGACAPRIETAGRPIMAPELTVDHILAADGAKLPLRVWRAEGEVGAVIVALHGFNDYSNAFDDAAGFWAKLGITTYAYDQRGFGQTANHGLWPGVDSLIDDLRSVTELIRRAHPATPLYLLGESMGGAVIMTLMARAPAPEVDGIVLVAPAVRGWQTMNIFYRAGLWIGAHVMPWATPSGRGLGIKPSDNREMLLALSRDPYVIKRTRIDALYGLVNLMDAAFDAAPDLTIPTLVLYGENDQLIPKGPTYDMLARLNSHHRVALYDTGYHMLLRDLDAETVLTDIAAWITDRQAALPSGREWLADRSMAVE
jgi:alpha-beta hydrolase superfamily lysophospholipase